MPLRVQLDALGALFLCYVHDYQISSTSVGSQEVILYKTTEVDTYLHCNTQELIVFITTDDETFNLCNICSFILLCIRSVVFMGSNILYNIGYLNISDQYNSTISLRIYELLRYQGIRVQLFYTLLLLFLRTLFVMCTVLLVVG